MHAFYDSLSVFGFISTFQQLVLQESDRKQELASCVLTLKAMYLTVVVNYFTKYKDYKRVLHEVEDLDRYSDFLDFFRNMYTLLSTVQSIKIVVAARMQETAQEKSVNCIINVSVYSELACGIHLILATLVTPRIRTWLTTQTI